MIVPNNKLTNFSTECITFIENIKTRIGYFVSPQLIKTLKNKFDLYSSLQPLCCT